MKFLTLNQKPANKIIPLSIAFISTLSCTHALAEENIDKNLTIDQLSGVVIEEKYTTVNNGEPVTEIKTTNSQVKITDDRISKQSNDVESKEVFEPTQKNTSRTDKPAIKKEATNEEATNEEVINKEVIEEVIIEEVKQEQPKTKDSVLSNENQTPKEPIADGGEAGAASKNSTETLNNLQPSVRPGKNIYKLTDYAALVNSSSWSKNMKRNTAMTVKLQALLDWNHSSPGPIDGGWGMNGKKALKNFQAMKGLKTTGALNEETWNALTKNIPNNEPVLYSYKITSKDTRTRFVNMPSGYAAKSKLKAMEYKDIYEKLAERFQMDVNYLKKLNKGKSFRTGETITVYNAGRPLKSRITRVVANKKNETLYAYNGKKLVATYPTTVGSSATPSPHGTFKIVSKVKMPWYNATVGEGQGAKKYKIAPGPNNPVGVVWMGLSKPSYGLHGSPVPEGISRQASHGCIRLTNWDVLEVYDNIVRGAKVVLE